MQDILPNTKEAFSKAASAYDKGEGSNAILQWMRSVVHNIYLENFKTGNQLLELSAGTGIDALFLARNGIKVFATDISENMIEVVKQKIKGQGAGDMIETAVCSFDEIGSVAKANFDGAISNFGGLNCINNFEKLSTDLYVKLKQNGKFIAVVMNRFCPWEILYYLIRLDFKNAFRRFKKSGVEAVISDEKIRTFYFSPKEFAASFSKRFKIGKIYSLGLFTPPPYLIGIYYKLKPVVKLLMGIDYILKSIFPFNRIGDHFIVVLTKK